MLAKDCYITNGTITLTSCLDPGSGRKFAKVIRGSVCKTSIALPPGFLGKDMFLLLTRQS